MFEQVLDNFRKATESSLQMQQEMLRNWMHQWPGASMMTMQSPNGWTDQFTAFQRKWNEGVSDLLNKHKEALDTQYRTGIRLIEEAFRVTDAREPEQARKLVEELWRHSYESFKTISENQMRDFQTVMEKWFETVSKGMPMGKP